MTNSSDSKRVERAARLRWVPISKMRVSPLAQRELNQARVDRIVANMDLEQLGAPTVSWRDGWYWIIDGQHRVEALKAFGFDGDQQVQCWCYEELAEAEEAEKFLKLNDYLAVSAFDKFGRGVVAGREVECDIDRVVRAQNLIVSRDELPGAVKAVGTLRRVYTRAGGPTLGRTLRIIRDAYGDRGLEAQVIDGLGLLCQRYNGEVDDATLVAKLSAAHGGVNGLLQEADVLRRKTGNYKSHCVAAAAVDIFNRGAGRGKKLSSWWK